jgi:hypothetical protein
MKHIDTWDDATWVFVFGPETFMTVLSVLVAVGLVVWFFAKMIVHENHAYAQIIRNEPVEPGPVAEGEPSTF